LQLPAATITAALIEAHSLTSDDVAETFVAVYDQLILLNRRFRNGTCAL